MFHRVVVLLDHLSPQQGAFPHALDWARRFRLPIHGIAVPAELQSHSPDPATVHQACANMCARFQIDWEISSWQGRAASDLQQVARPEDLVVFGQALPHGRKKELLRQTFLGSAPAVLLGSNTWSRPSRVLLVDDGNHPDGGFLVKAAEMSACLEAVTIVLTLARSERAARLRQEAAREALAICNVGADFDFMIGCETGAAVVSVARWRRCSVVVLEQHASTPWWRWSGGTAADWCVDLGDSLSFLALPGKAIPRAATPPECNAPAAS